MSGPVFVFACDRNAAMAARPPSTPLGQWKYVANYCSLRAYTLRGKTVVLVDGWRSNPAYATDDFLCALEASLGWGQGRSPELLDWLNELRVS